MAFFLAFLFALLASSAHASETQVERGEELYMFHCSTCHGREGGGHEEARLAFPEEERRCERCHAPRSPRQLPWSMIQPDSAFSVGIAPPLRGEGSLEGFGDALSLYHYVRAAMPRHNPGGLSDEQYLDIVAFIVARNGGIVEELDEASAASVPIRP